MTAALLVLEPIFEADLPSEIYAYRAGRNAQQAVVEVEGLVFRMIAGIQFVARRDDLVSIVSPSKS